MYASRHAIFFLAFFVALVSAVPLHNHHRRSKCHRRDTPTVSDGATPTRAAVAVPSDTDAPIPSSSVKPEDPKGPKETSKPSSSDSSSSGSSSSDAPAPSKSSSSSSGSGSGSGGVLGGLLDKLFPVDNFISSWTTSPSKGSLSLSDSTFRPTNVLKSLPHTYTDAPDGKAAMKAHYPKGSYNFGHNPQGGFSFYAPGPDSVDLSTAKEATFGYSVFFPEGFDFQKGGKLPGLYGGNSDEEAIGCSGGRRSSACFSARLMWRGEGDGEFYTYLPPSFDENQKVCNVKPLSDCNPTYGASVGRGSFTFATGQWTTVSERVRLNDVGKANGELQLFVNGKSVVNVSGLVLRDSSAGKIRGMQMQTFFGGSSPDFATPKDQDVYFSDFSVSITDKL